VFVSILFFQCQKELSGDAVPPPAGNSIVKPDPLTARLQGTVLNEAGQPTQGVTVKVGNQTATTDARGYFRFQNASLDKKSAVVTAEMSGYFKAYRSFAATTGTNQVVIKLIKKALIGSVDAATGGSVTLSNGAKIALPANGVVKASNNSAYTGSVNVYAAYIDPTTSDIDQVVPGSFMANDKNGARVILSSFGMLAVELESSSAEKLQIKSGSAATLTTPIPSSLQSNAPQTIALWSVDETTGIWKEEGTATKQGNVYVGDVKHFSFWNCDVSVNATTISMTIKDPSGAPLTYAMVQLKTTGQNPTQSVGWTDSLGQVAGYVPAGIPLILDVKGQCSNSIYTQNIAPITQPTNLGVITVTNSNNSLVTIHGTILNCSGSPVTSGYAIIYYGYLTVYVATNSAGNFSSTFPVCGTLAPSFSVLGIDLTTQQQSGLVTAQTTAPATNVGALQACGMSSAEYLNYTLDGSNYSLGPADSLRFQSSFSNLGNETLISGKQLSGTAKLSLKYTHGSPAAPGSFPILWINAGSYGPITPNSGSTVTITNYPATITDFLEGSFTAQFNAGGAVHNVNGNFRIRK